MNDDPLTCSLPAQFRPRARVLWGRLKRRPSEKLFPKRYASCFKGTALEQMLSTLGVDTVIVVGAIAPSL